MRNASDRRAALKTRFLEYGPDDLTDRELAELLAGFASGNDPRETALELTGRFGSLPDAVRAGQEELDAVRGIGGAAMLFDLVGKLIRRAQTRCGPAGVINSPARAGEFFVPRLMGLSRETMYALCLDMDLRPLSCKGICEGGLSALKVDIYGLAALITQTDAAAVIIAHNHPNGIAIPSREDRHATASIAKLLSDLGVVLLDHLVVAGADFVSMAAEDPSLSGPEPLRALNSAAGP